MAEVISASRRRATKAAAAAAALAEMEAPLQPREARAAPVAAVLAETVAMSRYRPTIQPAVVVAAAADWDRARASARSRTWVMAVRIRTPDWMETPMASRLLRVRVEVAMAEEAMREVEAAATPREVLAFLAAAAAAAQDPAACRVKAQRHLSHAAQRHPQVAEAMVAVVGSSTEKVAAEVTSNELSG